MTRPNSRLRVRGISKRFGANRVLRGVDLEIGHGEVVGLVGENGAGKSTLLNILSGIIAPDEGTIEHNGRVVTFVGYADASALGVSRVFQEQALIPNISVFENLLLPHQQRFGPLMRRKQMVALARSMMAEAGVAIDVTRTTSEYNFSQRQLIEIVRACPLPVRLSGIEHPVILLDEPTASLEKADEEVFFRLIERMRPHASFLFVSHRLTEVLSLSDRIYVLKDGMVVAMVDPAAADERVLHSHMVGRERDADYYQESDQRHASGEPVLFAARGLSQPPAFSDVDLAVRRGEVLGIGGLLMSGKSELGRALAGVDPPQHGEVRLGDGTWQRPHSRNLIKAGLGYVPAERLADGLIAGLPIAWNISLASGGDLFSTPAGLWRTVLETDTARRMIARLGVRGGGPGTPSAALSGGHQQKVVMARWLCRDLRVLILDNPTRGVDAGAKEEMYRIIRGLTGVGVAIVLITDELLELIGLSNRIAVMQHGRITALLDASADAKPTEQDLIELMLATPSRRERAIA